MNSLSVLLEKVTNRQDLSFDEAKFWQTEMMEGRCTPSQIAGFICALRTKGESVEEIAGLASAMRQKAVCLVHQHPILLDTCGTGGDAKGTFNISTLAALVVSGAGVPVAKHGNIAVSSQCGSADLLKNLGVKIDCDMGLMQKALSEAGICFLFAPLYHAAMKHAALPRKELGIRTVFNLLGPLSNPAGANIHVMGVYHKDLTRLMAEVLKRLGVTRAVVVHGQDGLDEATTTGHTWISEYSDDQVKDYVLDPASFGIKPASLNDILGGNLEKNTSIALQILEGQDGSFQDIVVLNAALALYAAGLSDRIKEAVEMARDTIKSGKARQKLEALIKITNSTS
ncbi:MAG: anthranilate phosphoribosyltransferase [Chlamydiota bacterium]|nr:anthranilate phosphoribosyltransferase [Chlamydiota bacterium]